MKKLLALLLALLMLLSLAGCGKQAQEDEEPAVIELTLWTFPAGDWGDPAAVETLLTQFNSVYPDIHVTVQCLDEATGDDKLSTAVDGGVSPDILLAQPDRLIKTWGAEGMLADLSDMWDDADKQEVNAACQSVCFTRDGKCYAYPFAMNVQCMAINYDAFVTAGADQYIDLETRTWTTEQFTQAVKALQSKYGETVAAVYCSGQNGDQGTRALVTNLYGGQFANDSYTGYVANSEANQQALTLLRDTKGIEFDDAINGQEEAALFYHESLKMSFCWSLAQQLAETVDEPTEEGGEPVVHPAGKTVNGQTIEFMSFPSETGESRLEGDISTMNFDSMAVPDYLPGPLWVDEKGQRFQNEAFAGPEINGFFMARAKRGNITSIYDSTYETQILRGFPGHQAFEYDMPAVVEAMKGNFEAAKAAGAEGANGWYCADTIEQLAEYIGLTA